MVDRDRDVYRTLDLALRVGETLMSNGAGAADVHVAMSSVARACGLRGAQPDVTFTELTMTWQPHVDEPPVTQTRRVTQREIDYEDLTAVDHILRDLVSGTIDREEARQRILTTTSTGHARARWAVTAAWGAMGVGIAIMIGGGWLVSLLAFVSAAMIDRVQRFLTVRRIPAFYQQVAGALVATGVALLSAAADLDVQPSRVVTAGIVMLLSGLGLVGATQDALAGYPITATARLLEVVLSTIGIVAGISAGLTLARMTGLDFGTLAPGDVALARLGVMTLGGAIAAAAFAYASYAAKRTLIPIALVSSLGLAVAFAGDRIALDRTWSTALAAVVVGVLSYSAAGRFRVPPLVVMVSALVPLLPGFTVYRGLALISAGQSGGNYIVAAAATALALAAGAILGQYLAQPVRKEARRLENRLAGPRLVGPLRSLTAVTRRAQR